MKEKEMKGRRWWFIGIEIAIFILLILFFFKVETWGIREKSVFGIGLSILCTFLVLPIWCFYKSMQSLLDVDAGEKELQEVSGKYFVGEEIEEVVDKFTSLRNKKDLTKVFDKHMELTALQSQINPHFLYNTLESIRGQALIDDNFEIAKMVEALASFFRYSISKKRNLVTLREELSNIQNYMLIQRYRFNNRFSLEVLIDEEDEIAYDYLIPKLIIQPVVENAVFHGLEEIKEGGKVDIEIIVTEKNMILTVSDNGKGMEKETLRKINDKVHFSDFRLEEDELSKQVNTGIGLSNIHKRIQLLFGEMYGIQIYSTKGQGTDVEITLPANFQEIRE